MGEVKKPKEPDIVKTKITRMLKHKFSIEELRDLAEMESRAVQDRQKRVLELKSVSAQYKSEIAALDTSIASAAEKYTSGFEVREIECEQTKNFKEGRFKVIRQDTFEIVEDRKLKDSELQTQMFDM